MLGYNRLGELLLGDNSPWSLTFMHVCENSLSLFQTFFSWIFV